MKQTCKIALALGSAAILLGACSTEKTTAKAKADRITAQNEHVTEELTKAGGQPLCLASGPQTPRDISNITGKNTVMFEMAPPASEMNLCNIHTHTNAEHKGPGFEMFVDDSEYGGYACNGTDDLSAAELAPYDSRFGKVQSGKTIEVHWVHTSCDATPGEGLGACVPESCTDPKLRVETQVFLLVNDRNAADFTDFAYMGNRQNARHQAKTLPVGTGTPITFRGSTTGPSYNQSVCSPAKVTWSVRPQCQKLDIATLDDWMDRDTVFAEKKSHGVRQLVTAPELLSAME